MNYMHFTMSRPVPWRRKLIGGRAALREIHIGAVGDQQIRSAGHWNSGARSARLAYWHARTGPAPFVRLGPLSRPKLVGRPV